MALGLFLISALLIVSFSSATQNYPEHNPKLEKYQDVSREFPLTETWYMVYRNFKDDPVFGTAMCIRLTEAEPEKDGEYPIIAEYGDKDQSTKMLATLQSSEGYSTKNQIIFRPEGKNETMTLQLAFLDHGKCGVDRNVYVNEGACSVFVPESQLGKDTSCCDFVFDLLCGTTRYPVYDNSCKRQN